MKVCAVCVPNVILFSYSFFFSFCLHSVLVVRYLAPFRQFPPQLLLLSFSLD